MKQLRRLFILATICLTCSCNNGSHSSIDESTKFTLGKAQREVHKGMAQADVATSLGSPNIVTRDAEGKETWVYDKIAKQIDQSRSDAGVWFLLGAASRESVQSVSSERSLTVLVKFDDDQRVDTLSYHSSSF